MVVNTDDFRAFTVWWPCDLRPKLGHRSIHLYVVLMGRAGKRKTERQDLLFESGYLLEEGRCESFLLGILVSA